MGNKTMNPPAQTAQPGGRFFDTNILITTQDPVEGYRRMCALAAVEAAMKADCFVISTQVMQEFHDFMLHKRWVRADQSVALLQQMSQHTVVPASSESVLRAAALQQAHGLSLWDALIVQAALDARCALLFTEDLEAGRRFSPLQKNDPDLVAVNPFTANAAGSVWALHEAPAQYDRAPPKRKLKVALVEK
jgi:predicted nucleic acid-binding protein